MKASIQQQIRNIDYIVSQKVKRRRVCIGITQQEIASALEVSIQRVQKYENNINRILSGKLYKIAHLLDMPLKKFFRKI